MAAILRLAGAENRHPGNLGHRDAGDAGSLAGGGVIGVIDSGLGGLAIARAIWERLPQQAMIYLADHAYFPYGNKSVKEINRRLVKIVDWFLEKKCRLVVIACNTITATVIDRLRRRYTIPFVGTEPAVKLGGLVLATETTVASRRFQALIKKHPVDYLACPGLAQAVEQGKAIEAFLPQLPKKTDTLVLGCTHYILVKDRIRRFYGGGITIIDPSEAIAKQTEKILPQKIAGRRQFFTTGDATIVTNRTSRLLRRRIIFSRCNL